MPADSGGLAQQIATCVSEAPARRQAARWRRSRHSRPRS